MEAPITREEARQRLWARIQPKPDIIRWNPFEDANDDYACLVWGRETLWKEGQRACDSMLYKRLRHNPFIAFHYKVGDYARALCAVFGWEVSDES